jgi:hypothetical protein
LRDTPAPAPADDNEIGPDFVGDLENRLRSGSVDQHRSMIDSGFAQRRAPAVEQYLDRTPPCIVKSGRGLARRQVIGQIEGVNHSDHRPPLLRELSHPLDRCHRAGGTVRAYDDVSDGHYFQSDEAQIAEVELYISVSR